MNDTAGHLAMRLWWALALCATLGCCRGRGRGRGMFVMVLLVPARTNGQNKPTSQPEATVQREKENGAERGSPVMHPVVP
jgi:hypothetical protein